MKPGMKSEVSTDHQRDLFKVGYKLYIYHELPSGQSKERYKSPKRTNCYIEIESFWQPKAERMSSGSPPKTMSPTIHLERP